MLSERLAHSFRESVLRLRWIGFHLHSQLVDVDTQASMHQIDRDIAEFGGRVAIVTGSCRISTSTIRTLWAASFMRVIASPLQALQSIFEDASSRDLYA